MSRRVNVVILRMFCSNCGKSDQQPNSYCRGCGKSIDKNGKISRLDTSVPNHFNANIAFSFLTATFSLALSISLYVIFLGRDDTHFIIYLTAGFLTAITGWQIQILIRTFQLRKHFRKQAVESRESAPGFQTEELIERPGETLVLENEFKTDDLAPMSITENSTLKLKILNLTNTEK